MRVRPSLVVALILSVLSLPSYAANKQRCGFRAPADVEMAQIDAGIDSAKGKVHGTVTVPVWVHVIRKGAGFANGELSNAAINSQIAVLNQSYLGFTGGSNVDFEFVLAGVTRTTNQRWFDNFALDFAVEVEAKTALRRGGSDTLNIYTADGVLYLGFAYLPKDATKKKYEALNLDGVFVDWRSLPGGNIDPYSEGDTATHEVGHWLGLLHTFEKGCSNKNDGVDDTPAEAGPNFVCTPGIDTCTGKKFPGVDPIENFMDYTEDFCMYKFTNGQAERMRAAWAKYRG
jgi:hypothetical protein